MQAPDENYNTFCETEVKAGATAGRMTGGNLQLQLDGLSAGVPEDVVAKLSIEDVLLQRTQLAIGKTRLDHISVQDIEQQQARWKGSACEASDKQYSHRKRLALELRFRAHEHNQKVGAQKGVSG